MKRINKNITKKGLLLFIGGFLVFLCLTGEATKIYNTTFKNVYTNKSITYLDNSIDKSTKIFLTLSGVKAVTAVIEGSELGISGEGGVGVSAGGHFSLELGDIVQSLYDTLDIMWKTTFLALISLSFQKIFLNYFPSEWMSYMIAISIILLLPSIFFTNIISEFFIKISRFISITFIIIYFIIPINIYMASKTSNYLDLKYRGAAISKLEKESKKLTNISARLERIQNVKKETRVYSKKTKWYDVRGKINNSINSYTGNIKSNFETFKAIIAEIKDIQSSLTIITKNIIKLSIAVVTIYLADAVLLPLIFLLLTYLLIRVVFLSEMKVIEKHYIKKASE